MSIQLVGSCSSDGLTSDKELTNRISQNSEVGNSEMNMSFNVYHRCRPKYGSQILTSFSRFPLSTKYHISCSWETRFIHLLALSIYLLLIKSILFPLPCLLSVARRTVSFNLRRNATAPTSFGCHVNGNQNKSAINRCYCQWYPPILPFSNRVEFVARKIIKIENNHGRSQVHRHRN